MQISNTLNEEQAVRLADPSAVLLAYDYGCTVIGSNWETATVQSADLAWRLAYGKMQQTFFKEVA